MEVILVDAENSIEHFVTKAKEALVHHAQIEIKGKGRDTVKAVDVAELLKIEGFKTGKIVTHTDEEQREGKALRTSSIMIEIQK
jgi:DNA-binding protein